jgi:hypothetical protein
MFGAPCHPSFASEKYRELSHKAMITFLNHVEGRYGDSIVDYQAENGFGGEWLTFNSFREVRPGAPPPNKFGVEDYSPPAQPAFRRWLKGKYGSVERLCRAWGDPKVTFETAPLPKEVERYSSTHRIFFDPAVSRRVADCFSFFNEMVAHVLLENCRSIKELTNRKKIVGASYGYLWRNFPNLSVVHSGHLGLAKILRSPDVDFIASPYKYDNKQIGPRIIHRLCRKPSPCMASFTSTKWTRRPTFTNGSGGGEARSTIPRIGRRPRDCSSVITAMP